jgi:hypothetical protein
MTKGFPSSEPHVVYGINQFVMGFGVGGEDAISNDQ